VQASTLNTSGRQTRCIRAKAFTGGGGHDGDTLGCHCKVPCSCHVGLLRLRPHPSGRAMTAPWRRDLLGGVVFRVPPFLLVVVVFGGVAGCAVGPCCYQGVEGPWVLVALCCRSRCSSELGVGREEEMLSLRS
jgi:hypothetical protein